MGDIHSVALQECLKFLREIQFGAAQVSSSSFHHSGAIMDLYSETSSTFLKVLLKKFVVVNHV